MQVTWTPTASVTDGQFLVALAPELIILIGVFLLILITNMGNARFRVPMTNLKLPWLLGGRRFKIASDPRIPAMFSSTILAIAFVMNIAWLTQSVSGSSGTVEAIYIVNPTALEPYILSDAILQIDVFARLFATLFTGALMIAAMASSDLIKPIANQRNPSLEVLYDNRRQVDFHILMLTTAFGMSIVALAQDLFVLFIGLELASMSSYVLVAFRKETQAGSEAGMKYFIVGSVASGVGLYGLSLLYLWGGSLQLYDLQAAWAAGTPSPLALIALGLILVGFGFKVSAAPFHFAAPDAYAGAASPVAGVLATASKGMGFIGLVRVLVIIAGPATGAAALWVPALAILSIVTMFWGNIAALGSDNPKRMLAYSSVAHAGYLMGALVAIGVNEDPATSNLILGAVIFHLVVLVTFKLGAFLVLGMIEKERSVSRLSTLGGLARREPLLALPMFIFLLCLAGVPPLSGFLSKFLLITGMVDMAADFGTSWADLHWIWWMVLAIFINSALSVFYYLRVAVVMFFDEPEEGREGSLPDAFPTRMAVWACTIGAITLGIMGDSIFSVCTEAAERLFGP